LIVDAIVSATSPSSFQTAAVVRAGYGRAVILAAGEGKPFIVTAAHCLPHSRYPRPHLGNTTTDLLLPRLVGTIGARRTISAQLDVLNLIDDVAVLTSPDNQELWTQAEEYEQFTLPCMTVGDAPAMFAPWDWHGEPGADGWVLSLELVWKPCTIHRNGRFLTTSGAKIEPGMSGSPILNGAGAVIGIISAGHEGYGNNWHPSLADCLPPWLWRKLTAHGVDLGVADPEDHHG
jgi:hypothetical protein